MAFAGAARYHDSVAEPGSPRPSHWPWALAAAAVAIVAILTGGVLYVFRSARSLPAELAEGGRQALRDLREVAAAFRTGTVTTTFRSYATEVSGTTRLQFAELRQEELFERRDSEAVLWLAAVPALAQPLAGTLYDSLA